MFSVKTRPQIVPMVSTMTFTRAVTTGGPGAANGGGSGGGGGGDGSHSHSTGTSASPFAALAHPLSSERLPSLALELLDDSDLLLLGGEDQLMLSSEEHVLASTTTSPLEAYPPLLVSSLDLRAFEGAWREPSLDTWPSSDLLPRTAKRARLGLAPSLCDTGRLASLSALDMGAWAAAAAAPDPPAAPQPPPPPALTSPFQQAPLQLQRCDAMTRECALGAAPVAQVAPAVVALPAVAPAPPALPGSHSDAALAAAIEFCLPPGSASAALASEAAAEQAAAGAAAAAMAVCAGTAAAATQPSVIRWGPPPSALAEAAVCTWGVSTGAGGAAGAQQEGDKSAAPRICTCCHTDPGTTGPKGRATRKHCWCIGCARQDVRDGLVFVRCNDCSRTMLRAVWANHAKQTRCSGWAVTGETRGRRCSKCQSKMVPLSEFQGDGEGSCMHHGADCGHVPARTPTPTPCSSTPACTTAPCSPSSCYEAGDRASDGCSPRAPAERPFSGLGAGPGPPAVPPDCASLDGCAPASAPPCGALPRACFGAGLLGPHGGAEEGAGS